MTTRPTPVWGKRPNTVPSTRLRDMADPRGHSMPKPGTGTFQATLDRHGEHWPGTSKIHDRAARRRRNRATMAAHRAASARLIATGVSMADHARDVMKGRR